MIVFVDINPLFRDHFSFSACTLIFVNNWKTSLQTHRTRNKREWKCHIKAIKAV